MATLAIGMDGSRMVIIFRVQNWVLLPQIISTRQSVRAMAPVAVQAMAVQAMAALALAGGIRLIPIY